MEARVKPAHDRDGSAIVASTMIVRLKCPRGYCLRTTFSDGTAGEHDFSALVSERAR
jgi:hypothetical protein